MALTEFDGMPVISDDNAGQFINPVVDGHQRMCSLIPRDYDKYPEGGTGFAAIKTLPTYSKPDLIAMIREREAQKSGLSHLIDRAGVHVKDQDGIPYCWIYSVVHTVEIHYAIQGDGFIPLSATSAGTLITGGRKRGGYGAEGIDFMSKYGTCREKDWPEYQVNPRLRSERTDAFAKESIITDWGELPNGNLDQLASAVMHYYPVTIGLPWWGHQVTIIDLTVLPDGNLGFVFNNSWGRRWGNNGRGVLRPEKARGNMFYPISVRPRRADFLTAN